jgi:hypothetical protein
MFRLQLSRCIAQRGKLAVSQKAVFGLKHGTAIAAIQPLQVRKLATVAPNEPPVCFRSVTSPLGRESRTNETIGDGFFPSRQCWQLH